MEAHEEELIKTLVPHNDELRQAYEEHRRLKRQVEEYAARGLLTPEEELEKKELQKRKLAEKDRIMQILAAHRQN